MSNNFRKTAVLKKKKKNRKLKLLRYFWGFFFKQIFGAVAVLKFSPDACFRFSIFVCNFSRKLLVGRRRNFYGQMYRKFSKVVLLHVAACNALKFFSVES